MDKIEVTRRPHDILRIAPNNFTELLRITPTGEVIAPSLEAASEAGRYFVESMRGHLEVMREAIRAEILATRTDATPVAEVAELRGNISIMEAALQQIAGTHAERFGMCQTDVEEVPDLSAEEAVSIARNALEAAGDTHPPTTDVAALVEAAKAFQHYGCPVCSVDCGSANPPVIACPMKDLSAALAPFTKGHDDEHH